MSTPTMVSPSEQLLRDLIFTVTGFHLPAQATFGIPKALTPLQGDAIQNDTAVLVSMPQSPYGGDTGSKWLYYNRMDLGRLQPVTLSGILLPPGTAFTLSSMLPQINTLYGVNLDVSDIVDANYVAGNGPYTMQASSNSLAWEGQLNVAVVVDLSLMTPVTSLAGFDPAAMLLASTNLTGFKDIASV